MRRKCIPQNQLFKGFKSEFDASTIRRLRAFDISKKKDSTFILVCMKKLFGNDKQLKNVTACGRRKSNLSPEKRKILDNLFVERLATEQIDSNEAQERYLRVNTLINNAIANIVRVSFNSDLCMSCDILNRVKF